MFFRSLILSSLFMFGYASIFSLRNSTSWRAWYSRTPTLPPFTSGSPGTTRTATGSSRPPWTSSSSHPWTSSSWHPWTSSTWRPWTTSRRPWPTGASPVVYCNNYRDIGIREFPKVGDLACKAQQYYTYGYGQDYYGGELLLRETLLQTPLTHSSVINYRKIIRGVVSSVSILNFGEAHGFVKQIVIQGLGYGESSVRATIEIPEGREVKLFVEIYGKQ